ncbi:hypothetical protein [Pseudomonas gingeri]|uniref:hypothetical protein n=1 Tax=Pseudomonas gingeri TaxID=117681 RepID=UPI0015A46FC4|nr:hypothetical protein [Pseudomonas gingeri]NWE49778.1 hypothetical protein [Pseudomonas gingeri]
MDRPSRRRSARAAEENGKKSVIPDPARDPFLHPEFLFLYLSHTGEHALADLIEIKCNQIKLFTQALAQAISSKVKRFIRGFFAEDRYVQA